MIFWPVLFITGWAIAPRIDAPGGHPFIEATMGNYKPVQMIRELTFLDPGNLD